MKFRESTHKNLSSNDARLQLAGLGVLAGIIAGLCVNLFRFVLETPFPMLGIADNFDDFESLPAVAHFFLPVSGCILLAAIYRFVLPEHQILGVTHVIDKVQNLQGRLPLKNALLQFTGASIALLSGQSCGREGPSIHLGATSGSLLGQLLNLPNNANRILIACGSAAAISAAFNTPIAGVVFAMEVIMMEYTISGFLPVIVAAVSAAVTTQILHASETVFSIGDIGMNSLWELPYVVFLGLVIGILSGTFIHIQKFCMKFSSIKIHKRLLLIGVLTGTVAILVPEIMGTGYDSLNNALQNNLSLHFLLLLLLAKLLLTAVALGLGLPGGVIGPTLIIGGIAGAILGIVGDTINSYIATDPGFYVLMGMCAMMGAVLQVPLAALMALLELSGNPDLLLPAMLAIVVANLTTSEGFRLQSVFQIALQQQGIKTPKTLNRLLNRYGVNSIMETAIKSLDLAGPKLQAEKLETDNYKWVILKQENEYRLLAATELDPGSCSKQPDYLQQSFLRASPLAAISLHATLQEAMEIMQKQNLGHAYVYSPIAMGRTGILGIISLDAIIAFYKER